jgi:hypothetical protein
LRCFIIEKVSAFDMLAYCRRLSLLTGVMKIG